MRKDILRKTSKCSLEIYYSICSQYSEYSIKNYALSLSKKDGGLPSNFKKNLLEPSLAKAEAVSSTYAPRNLYFLYAEKSSHLR